MSLINPKTRKNSFTLIEIIIVLVIIGILATLSFYIYTHFIEKAKTSEAVIVAGNIRGAEIANKLDKGEYVGAENIGEINNSLGLSIIPKNYNYRVVGVSDQDFMLLVNKIDTGEIVLAMNKDGFIRQEYGSSGGGTDSSGGGTGGSGGGTDSSGGGTGGVITSLSNTGGGWSNLAPDGGSGALIADGLLEAFNLLKNSTTASYVYNLIEDKEIPLMFAIPPLGFESAGAWWDGYGIFVNTSQQDAPASALAALIAHESTHADYSYFSDAWIDITLQRHPELQITDIHAPSDSFDQEYNAYCNEMNIWIELKGTDTNSFQDDWLAVYNQGEEYMRTEIRSTYRANGQDLPEY